MVFVDPQTRQRVVSAKHVGDIMYDPINTGSTLANESVPIIGPWSDSTGSSAVFPNSRMQQIYGGHQNLLQGQDAAIEGGAVLHVLNEVGENVLTIRRRQKKIYRELTPEGKLK